MCYNTFQQDVRRRFCGRGVVARATSSVYYFVAVAFREEQIEVLKSASNLKSPPPRRFEKKKKKIAKKKTIVVVVVQSKGFDFLPNSLLPSESFSAETTTFGRFPRVSETLASGERVAPDMGTRETNHSRHRGTAWRWEEHSGQTGVEAVSEAAKKQ